MCRRISIIIILTYHLMCSFSQPRLKFERINKSSGLSQNEVGTVVRDSLGFLWIGTDRGLNRYDGHRFLHFFSDTTRHNTISADKISGLYKRRNGNILIRTKKGLDELNPYSGKIIPQILDSFSHDLTIPKDIIAITEDQEENLWLGTNEGIFKVHNSTHFVEHSKKDSSITLSNYPNRVRSILADKHGNIWVGMLFEGLFKLNHEKKY